MEPDTGASEAVARLDTLEADVASVAAAMESLDRIVAEVAAGRSASGESAAAEIAAIVSPDRFPLDGE